MYSATKIPKAFDLLNIIPLLSETIYQNEKPEIRSVTFIFSPGNKSPESGEHQSNLYTLQRIRCFQTVK